MSTARDGRTVPSPLQRLSELERSRVRRLALRHSIRSDGTLRSITDVTEELLVHHGIQLTPRKVFDLLNDGPQP